MFNLSLARQTKRSLVGDMIDLEKRFGSEGEIAGRYSLNLDLARMSVGHTVGTDNPTRAILDKCAEIDRTGGIYFDEARFERLYNKMKLERIGLTLGNLGVAAPPISDLPAWCYVSPWDEGTARDKFVHYPHQVKRNRASNGLRIETDDPRQIMEVDAANGGRSHAAQFARLFSSISGTGYRIDLEGKDPLQASILLDDRSWCWKLESGHHRVLVASMLGLEMLPVAIRRVIPASTARFWPGVRSGDYTAETAARHLAQVISGPNKAEAVQAIP
ncbi:MAG TPA: hypothetical protein DCG44_04985 [Candidatus Aquiluna sp.]|nr:hypothetical protein [Aquiluna sp.]